MVGPTTSFAQTLHISKKNKAPKKEGTRPPMNLFIENRVPSFTDFCYALRSRRELTGSLQTADTSTSNISRGSFDVTGIA
jgi:hypothetical protein